MEPSKHHYWLGLTAGQVLHNPGHTLMAVYGHGCVNGHEWAWMGVNEMQEVQRRDVDAAECGVVCDRHPRCFDFPTAIHCHSLLSTAIHPLGQFGTNGYIHTE